MPVNKGAKPPSDASKQAGAGAAAVTHPIKASQPAAPLDKRAGGAKPTEHHTCLADEVRRSRPA